MNCSRVIDEIVALSFEIYRFLLSEATQFGPITLCCPGQSPAYIALAMKNLACFNKDLVDVVVLPYSRGGNSTISLDERRIYGRVLKTAGINFRDNIYILDYVNSGAGINTFEKMLISNNIGRFIKKLAIVDPKYKPSGVFYKSFPSEYIHNLSDIYSRIIQHYPVANFMDIPFYADFINVDENMVATVVKERAIRLGV
jgi:hypothetical protein